VRATVALARLIRDRQPKLFDFCFSLHKKERVAQELGLPASPQNAKPFLHVSGMFPAERGCLAVMWPLATHPVNKNEVIAWDLAEDPAQLATLNVDEIRLRLFSRSSDLPEGVGRLPVKTVHLNKSPMVVGSLKTLTPAQAAHWGVDMDAALRHAATARDLPDMSAIWPKVFAREPQGPVDVDEDLYGGFVGNADRRRLNDLRRLDGPQLAKARNAFDDKRLEEIVFRYRARNFLSTLSADELARWDEHRAARLLEGEGGAKSVDAYFAEIDSLSEAADERGEEILGALYDWAEMVAPER
jgi:exodeoxyribonuclease-1